jgi:mannose-6-phosphate isomerase-like protein (cupin superfamily)
MSTEPRIVDLNQLPWQAHPTLAGVHTRIVENRATHGQADVMAGQIAVGGTIPWHVHAEASETAIVLQGKGTIQYTQSKTDADSAPSVEITQGTIVTLHAGWWHCVNNTGDEPMILYAFHTPPTF